MSDTTDTTDLILTDDELAAIRTQLRAAWDRRGAFEDVPESITFAESDLPDSCFAYVPDDAKGPDGAKSKRKLRLCSLETGKLDAGIVGAAKAALGKGYRGNRVQLPSGEREAAIRKVNAAAKKLDLEPFEGSEGDGIQTSDAALAFAERAHTGLLVALWLDPETAETLALEGGEASDSLHITLCYAGDVDDLGELAVARAVAAVERELSWREPLTGKVGGYGRFLASDTSDGQDVFYAAVDVPGLAELRQVVTMALIESGCAPSAKHGFTPHITLAYLPTDATNPIDRLPATELRFDAVTVKAGERRIDIPLMPPMSLFAVRDDDPQEALHVYTATAFAEPPDWAPFLPVPGTYHHPLYGELDFSPATYERILANYKAGVYQDKLPVNAEHDPQSSGAVGWIVDMRLAESGAIEVKVEWNDRGRALLEGDRYKYVSAELMPEWVDPVDPELRYEHLATGMAITTKPYFKSRVLPPLAASEAMLSLASGSAGEGSDMGKTEEAQNEQTPAATEQAVTEEPTNDAATEAKRATVQMNEQMLQQFRELKAENDKTKQELSDVKARNAELHDKALVKEFTDEVRGRSDDNGVPWVGDIKAHVEMLTDLAKAFGEDSEQVKRYIATNRAQAEQSRTTDLFREFGTSRGGDSSGQARIDAATDEVLKANPKLTREQAETQVLNEHPELYSQYLRERR